jgi:hypothetical protein
MSEETNNNEAARRDVVIELYESLAATAERPVERTASRWIGEAEAIAADLIDAPDDPDVIHDRATHIVSLLENVDETGDQVATEHVELAKALAGRLASD